MFKLRPYLSALAFGLAYFLAAEVGHALSFQQASIATFWPPSGIFVGVLFFVPPRRWPWFIAAAIAANLVSDIGWHQKPPLVSLGFTLANSVEAVVGAYLLQRFREPHFTLRSRRHVLLGMPLAALAAACGATIGAAIVCFWQPTANYFPTWAVWWSSDVMGMLLVGPLVVAALRQQWDNLRLLSWPRRFELVAMLASTALLSHIVFSDVHPVFGFTFAVIPILLWPALRFCAKSVSLAIVVIALVAIWNTLHGRGPIAQAGLPVAQQVFALQFLLSVAAVPFLVLAAGMHELQAAADDLETRIAERTRQLAEADQRKDHFLAVLAHELRNPLAPISNALAVWPALQDNPAEQERLRGMMQSQLGHVLALVDELLDVNRISRGKVELRRQPIDLVQLLRDAVDCIRPMANKANQSLDADLPDKRWIVEGDPVRLKQVFDNLLHNASKYAGDNARIRLTATASNGLATVHVQDNGPGIPAEYLQRIFEPFTQVDQSLERAHGGLGIGLTLVRSLIESHGGTVSATSDGPNLGSDFAVTLPLTRVEPLAASSSSSTSKPQHAHDTEVAHADDTLRIDPPAGLHPAPAVASEPSVWEVPPRRVLVVDDVRASARTLAMVLKRMGHEVETRNDGSSAIEAALDYRPDVIFLDIAMPGMSGYEVARQLRSDAAIPDDLLLVALTGYGQEEDRRQALAAGFDVHMVKPVDVHILAQFFRNPPAASRPPLPADA
ncbi:MAG: MASE1 domain-containing protein [Planctomycetales bacterium]|nr:MASE1 domain-containing protein [Planctomycetales bacterium]